MRFSAFPNHFKQLVLHIFYSQVPKLYHSLLCFTMYVWLFLYCFPRTCWQRGIHNTSHRHSGSACTRTHFPRHSQWIYSPMYWEQTAICHSASETSRSILERNVLKAHDFCNFRFCFKQANDENKLAKAVQRQKESAKLQKPSGGKAGILAHLQGWRGRQEVNFFFSLFR